jgi:hypothetical protein
MSKREICILVRNIVIALIGYGLLVVAYAVFVAPLLEEPLDHLFDNTLTAYAFIGLVLVVVQGLILDGITSFLINQLHLDRLG